MVEIRGTFIYPDGLTPGRSRDGGLSQLVYDAEGRLADHGTFVPDEDDGDDDDYRFTPEPEADPLTPEEAAQAVAVVLGVALVIVTGAVRAAPLAKRWWDESALPRLRSLLRIKRPGAPTSTELVSFTPAEPADFADVVDAALEDSKTPMASDEARRRLLAVLAASAFIAEQMRTLADARIEDVADLPELQSTMDKLSAEHVTSTVNRMLEGDAALLDEEASAEFMRIFGGGGVVDGRYQPLRPSRVAEALRLPAARATADEDTQPR